MTRWTLALGLGGLAGCGTDVEPPSPWGDGCLQPAEVVPEEELDFPRLDVRGSLTVRVEGTSWTLAVLATGGTQRVEVEVKTPTNPDILTFDGTEGVMSLREENGGVSVALRDTEDRLTYLLEPVTPTSLSDELFGTGFAAFASDLGPINDPGWKVRIRGAFVRTDEGDVELFPGEPQAITLEGATYRALLLSGYQLVEYSPTCVDLVPERLALELVRVDEPVLDPLTRPEGVSLTGAICAPQ